MSNFSLGNLCASRLVASKTAENRDFENFIWRSLDRYRQGDWGDLSAADKRDNDLAVQQGDLRIFAAWKRSKRKFQSGYGRAYTTLIRNAGRNGNGYHAPGMYLPRRNSCAILWNG